MFMQLHIYIKQFIIKYDLNKNLYYFSIAERFLCVLLTMYILLTLCVLQIFKYNMYYTNFMY